MTLVNDLKKVCKEATGSFVSIDLQYPTVTSILEKNTKIVVPIIKIICASIHVVGNFFSQALK